MNPLTKEKSYECNRPDGFCINCFYCGTRTDPNETSGWGLCNCEKTDYGKWCFYSFYQYIILIIMKRNNNIIVTIIFSFRLQHHDKCGQ